MDNLTEKQIDYIINSVEFISEHELEDIFEEYLESISEGDIYIFGYCYDVAFALKSVDPIAYREEFLSWLDMQLQENIYVEINGDYYDTEQVQDALDSLEETAIYNMAESDLEVNND